MKETGVSYQSKRRVNCVYVCSLCLFRVIHVLTTFCVFLCFLCLVYVQVSGYVLCATWMELVVWGSLLQEFATRGVYRLDGELSVG